MLSILVDVKFICLRTVLKNLRKKVYHLRNYTRLMKTVIDNLEQLLDTDEDNRYEDEMLLSDKIQEVFDRGIIQTEALR